MGTIRSREYESNDYYMYVFNRSETHSIITFHLYCTVDAVWLKRVTEKRIDGKIIFTKKMEHGLFGIFRESATVKHGF